MPRPRKINTEKLVEERLEPVETSISATQNAIKLLEENTKKSLTNMESSFKGQLVEIQSTMKEILAFQKNREKETVNTHENSDGNNEAITDTSSCSMKSVQGIRLSNVPGPEKIVENLTLAQFKDWRRKFENYIVFQGLQNGPPGQITALLTTFFNQDVSDVVRLVLKLEDTLSISASRILDKLEEYFEKKENSRIRRSQFMNRKQETGESFLSFYREKVKLLQLTNPCKECTIDVWQITL